MRREVSCQPWGALSSLGGQKPCSYQLGWLGIADVWAAVLEGADGFRLCSSSTWVAEAGTK